MQEKRRSKAILQKLSPEKGLQDGMSPDKAFILAAGRGVRMRPLTARMPKPLVCVGGRSLLAHALDKLEAQGVTQVTVNLHHHGHLIRRHLEGRPVPAVTFSPERTLLDTGGGIKNALTTMGNTPFFVLSGDSFWCDNPAGSTALQRLCAAWDPRRMDILILLEPVTRMRLTTGVGDYDLTRQGLPVRRKDRRGQYMFTSIRLNAPSIFEHAPDGSFSYLGLMDRAEQQGRLHAVVHDGQWHHLSTPEDLARVNRALAFNGPDFNRRIPENEHGNG